MNKEALLNELTRLAKENNDIGKFGDGYEKAINEAIRLVKNCSIPDVVVPKGTLCPSCGEDESIEDWQTYYRCKLCDTKF